MKYKSQVGRLLFVTLFFVLCAAPSVGMLLLPEQEPVGNEHLAPAPLLFERDGALNQSFLAELSDYIGDHVAFRHEMISLNSKLNSVLFSAVTNEDVLQGEEGWLYYEATLPDYQGTELLTARQCYAAGKTLQLMEEYCNAQGASFLFTIAPNKNSLYGDYMPARYAASAQAGNAEQLAAALEQLGVPYADLFTPFLEEEEVLYYQTDSHWNDRGAALASDVLCGALNKDAEGFYGGAYTMSGTHRGDLYEMVYPAGDRLEANAVFERDFTFDYADNYRTPEDITIRTSNPAKEGSLLMFRDSFGNALHPYVAEEFGRACFSRAMPYDLTYLEREEADTVVVEIVERNLDWLVSKPPILPAPQREIAFPEADGPFTASARASASNALAGYVQLTGTIDCAEMDEDSPIYIRINGTTIYEATPAGSGEAPFTAFVQDEPIERAEICICVNNSLTACVVEWNE